MHTEAVASRPRASRTAAGSALKTRRVVTQHGGWGSAIERRLCGFCHSGVEQHTEKGVVKMSE